mgnify:CR=1 FL=1
MIYVNMYVLAGWINVEWDTGLMLPYRYGCNGLFNAYDIEPCEEPRIRQNHTIAVGCLVQRGISNLRIFFKKNEIFSNVNIDKICIDCKLYNFQLGYITVIEKCILHQLHLKLLILIQFRPRLEMG